ncbi:MAG: ATP-grasp domain-containing protein [Saprospiraceae bacterium]
MDREKQNVIIYSTKGGMNIEEVAEETPHLVHKEYVDPELGLLPFHGEKCGFQPRLKWKSF